MKNLIVREKEKEFWTAASKKNSAWIISTKKPRSRWDYFFKNRIGKRAVQQSHKLSNKFRSHAYLLQATKTSLLHYPQLGVLWRAVRRRSRRFKINLRRVSNGSWLRLTATWIRTLRTKGGRMGGKKSDTGTVDAFVQAGTFFFVTSELRKSPITGFCTLISISKKISSCSKIKYIF